MIPRDFNPNRWRAQWAFGAARRARFHQKMVQFTRNGKSVTAAINLIHKRYAKEGNALAYMTGEWVQQAARKGFTMKVTQGWIPDAELGLIMAGESGDSITEGFRQAEKLARAQAMMKSQTLKAIGTPLIAILLALVLILGFRLFLSPVLTEIAPINKWPLSARLLYNVSGFLLHFGWALALGAPFLALMIIKSMPVYTGSYRPLLDKIPPWSIYKVMQASGFTMALAGMMKQGKPLDSAIKEYRLSASAYVRKFLAKMQARKATGIQEAAAMNVGFLDKETAGDIIDMGESGGLEVVMQSIGEETLQRAVEGIEIKAAVLKYILLVFVAMCLLWVFSSFVMTSYSAAEAAKKEAATVGY